jgi:glutamine synthetase
MTGSRRMELGITQLPTTLEEALNHMDGDDFVQGVLGREIVGIFLDVKRREYRNYLEAKAKGAEEERRWELSKYLVRT